MPDQAAAKHVTPDEFSAGVTESPRNGDSRAVQRSETAGATGIVTAAGVAGRVIHTGCRGHEPQSFGRVARGSDHDPERDPDGVVMCPVGVVDSRAYTLRPV